MGQADRGRLDTDERGVPGNPEIFWMRQTGPVISLEDRAGEVHQPDNPVKDARPTAISIPAHLFDISDDLCANWPFGSLVVTESLPESLNSIEEDAGTRIFGGALGVHDKKRSAA